jgi:predicted secreted protein
MPTKHDSKTDIFRGQLFIFAGDNPVAFGTSASLNISVEEVDVSNKMIPGNWKVSLPGQKSFSITSESLLTRKAGEYSFDSMFKKISTGETLEFFLGEATVTDPTNMGGEFALDTTKAHYTGEVMIASLDITSEVNGIATCSASFTGIGALSEVEGVIQT